MSHLPDLKLKIYMDYVWMTHGWRPVYHPKVMDYAWITYRLLMDDTWMTDGFNTNPLVIQEIPQDLNIYVCHKYAI